MRNRNTPAGRRACLYVSSAQVAQAEETQAMQMASLVEIASVKGLDVVATYSDWGVSGLGEKPGLTALIEAAKRGEFDVVIVKEISAFGRDAVLMARRIDELCTADVQIWTPAVGEIDGLKAFAMMVNERISKERGRRIAMGNKLAAERRLTASLKSDNGNMNILLQDDRGRK